MTPDSSHPSVVRAVRAVSWLVATASWIVAVHGCTSSAPAVIDEASDDLARVTIALTGPGSGSVTSETGGIACPPDCTADVEPGTRLRMMALADPHAVLDGWTGCAEVDEVTCTVEARGAVSIEARFGMAPTHDAVALVDVDCDGAGAGETCTMHVTASNRAGRSTDDRWAGASFTLVAEGAEIVSVDAGPDVVACSAATASSPEPGVRMAVVCPEPFPSELPSDRSRLATVTLQRSVGESDTLSVTDAALAAFGGGRRLVDVTPWTAP